MSLKAMPCRVDIKVVGSCTVSLASLYHSFCICIMSFGGCIYHVIGCPYFLEALHPVNGDWTTLLEAASYHWQLCIVSQDASVKKQPKHGRYLTIVAKLIWHFTI